ncbi:MAG: YicC/YloC family endoribonuclease [Nitrospinota bacterium]
MWRSMTGWGKGVSEKDGQTITVEVRSVNHRFFEVSVKTSRSLSPLEPFIRDNVRSRFDRGKFDVLVAVSGDSLLSREIRLDRAAAEQYLAGLKGLKEDLNLPGEITVETLARMREIFFTEENGGGPELGPEILQPCLTQALDSLEVMRRTEGKALAEDISNRLAEVSNLLNRLKETVPATVELYRERLRGRLAELVNGEVALDPGRLEQEIVLLTQRSDTSEEITRLESHIDQFREQLAKGSPAGRKLDFLLQEMHREVNTVGSKSLDARVSALVIDLKGELERIREQAQNLE